MSNALRFLFAAAPLKPQAHALYLDVVAQARQPFLYEGYGVPDTLDGRFDALLLHLFLLLHRLKRAPDPAVQGLARTVMEIFIADMDRTLREMGVGDTGVGKRIKHMAAALLGRLNAYEESMDDPAAFECAVWRNVYREAPESREAAARLARYACACLKALEAQDTREVAAGRIRFVN